MRRAPVSSVFLCRLRYLHFYLLLLRAYRLPLLLHLHLVRLDFARLCLPRFARRRGCHLRSVRVTVRVIHLPLRRPMI